MNQHFLYVLDNIISGRGERNYSGEITITKLYTTYDEKSNHTKPVKTKTQQSQVPDAEKHEQTAKHEKCHLTWRRIEAHSTVVILVLECSSIFAAASELVVCSCRRAFWPLKKKKQAVKSFQSRPQTLLTKLCFIKCMFYFEVYRRKRKLLLRLILFHF